MLQKFSVFTHKLQFGAVCISLLIVHIIICCVSPLVEFVEIVGSII